MKTLPVMEFDLDQDLPSLARCYSYTGAPQSTVETHDPDAPIEDLIMQYAAAARECIRAAGLERQILHALEEPQEIRIADPRVQLELLWFAFGHKEWRTLNTLVFKFACDGTCLPSHVADLLILSILRLHRPTLRTGKEGRLLLEALDSALRLIKTIWPEDRCRHDFFDAVRLNLSGNVLEARDRFAETPRNLEFVPYFNAVRAVLKRPLAPMSPHAVPIFPARADQAIVVSTDETYFREYGRAFIHSMENLSGVGLHIHCIGFDPRPALDTWAIKTPIGFSLDDGGALLSPATNDTAYYAGARYLYAPDYLDHYEKILITDIDGVAKNGPDKIFATSPEADVFLNATVLVPNREITPLPWSGVAAGAAAFSNSPSSRLFARQVAQYLHNALKTAQQHGGSAWYADQVALFYSWYDLRDRVAFGKISVPAFSQAANWRLFQGDREKAAHQVATVEARAKI